MANAAPGADTFSKLLVRNARLYGARPAMRHKDLGIWQSWTWSQSLELVRAYAVGLHRLGVKRGETIAIVGANRPKLYWSVMAAQMLGAIPVPVYADAVADELAYVLAHADVRFAAVEDQEQIDKIQSVMQRLPKLEFMVYDENAGCGTTTTAGCGRWTMSSRTGARPSPAIRQSLRGSTTKLRLVKAPNRPSFSTRRGPRARRRAWCSRASDRSMPRPIPLHSTS